MLFPDQPYNAEDRVFRYTGQSCTLQLQHKLHDDIYLDTSLWAATV